MSLNIRLTLLAASIGLVLVAASLPAAAAVTDIRAHTLARVTQLVGDAATQSDFDEQTVPGTAGPDPVVSRAEVEGKNDNGDITSSARSAAVFRDPRGTGAFPPNDIGVDVGSFSIDGVTAYDAEGNVTETRTITFTSDEMNAIDGSDARIRSVSYVAGALVVAARDADADLTGLEIHVRMQVTQKLPDTGAQTVLEAGWKLSGGPNAQLTLTGEGIINADEFPQLDLLSFDPSLEQDDVHFARAIIFAANTLGYEYNVKVGQQFDLTADFSVTLHNVPNNVVSAAVFGLPQGALADSMRSVKQGTAGDHLQQVVSSLVDTRTGAKPRATLPNFLPAVCGTMSLEAVATAVGLGWLAFAGTTRARRRRRIAP